MQQTKCRKHLRCENYPNCKSCLSYECCQEAQCESIEIEKIAHVKTVYNGSYYVFIEKTKSNGIEQKQDLTFDNKDVMDIWRLEELKKMYSVSTPYDLAGKKIQVIILEDDAVFVGNGNIFFKATGNEKELFFRDEVLATEAIFG